MVCSVDASVFNIYNKTTAAQLKPRFPEEFGLDSDVNNQRYNFSLID